MFDFLRKDKVDLDKADEKELLKILIEAQNESNRQQLISNALEFLNFQYNSTDRVMSLEDIKKYSSDIAQEIFTNFIDDKKENR